MSFYFPVALPDDRSPTANRDASEGTAAWMCEKLLATWEHNPESMFLQDPMDLLISHLLIQYHVVFPLPAMQGQPDSLTTDVVLSEEVGGTFYAVSAYLASIRGMTGSDWVQMSQVDPVRALIPILRGEGADIDDPGISPDPDPEKRREGLARITAGGHRLWPWRDDLSVERVLHPYLETLPTREEVAAVTRRIPFHMLNLTHTIEPPLLHFRQRWAVPSTVALLCMHAEWEGMLRDVHLCCSQRVPGAGLLPGPRMESLRDRWLPLILAVYAGVDPEYVGQMADELLRN